MATCKWLFWSEIYKSNTQKHESIKVEKTNKEMNKTGKQLAKISKLSLIITYEEEYCMLHWTLIEIEMIDRTCNLT